MNPTETIQLLNELLRILSDSLPAYLADAAPWTKSDDRRLAVALDRLAADQLHYARRLSDEITALGGRPDVARFDINFAAKNDLSLDFLLNELIERQRQDIAAIERCADQLENDSALHSLAGEILGNARGHMDVLKQNYGK